MDSTEEANMLPRLRALTPLSLNTKYMEGPNFVCCTEDIQLPPGGPCIAPESLPCQTAYCLSKQKPLSVKPIKKKVGNEKDILHRPVKWRCKPKRICQKLSPSASLGAPIGLAHSSFNMSSMEPKSSNIALQGFATILVAFSEYYITPECEWTETILNRLLMEGQRIFTESLQELEGEEPLKEANIKKSFVLCDNAFDLIVKEPFLLGHVYGEEFPVPSLEWGLEKFFLKNNFCLVQLGSSWYTLIWKNFDVYFVFDCFGRRVQDFQRDRKQGVSMLICLRCLDNVMYLLLKLTGVKTDEIFSLRQLQVRGLIPCGGKPCLPILERVMQYEVLQSDYALLRGTIYIGSRCFMEIRHRQSLPIAISALVNAKIDGTPTWDSRVIDKILKIGTYFYKNWTQRDVGLDLGIQDIPEVFEFGQYTVRITIRGFAECGIWKCTPHFKDSELSNALERAFRQGQNLILQIQGRSYALWKKGTFFYVLDPYSHQCSLNKKKLSTATVRMCGSLARLTCVFTQALLELFEESQFVIHQLTIIELDETAKLKERKCRDHIPCRYLGVEQLKGVFDVASLNDSVIGVDDLIICPEEVLPVESDGDDLDSPGLSQTRLDNYTDLRKDAVSEEEEMEETEELDLDKEDDDLDSDKNEDEDDEGEGALGKDKKKKRDKKSKDKGGKDDGKDYGKDDVKGDGKDDGKDKTKDGEGKDGGKGTLDEDAPPSKHDKTRSSRGSDEATTDHGSEGRQGARRRHQRRKEQDGDESDDRRCGGLPNGCLPNSYPGFVEDAQDLAVVGSESGRYESLCTLLSSAFRCADRVLTMTPWGNYVAFRSKRAFFIFDGCTCNLRSIRHMDLSIGTAGLICFADLYSLIKYIENGKEVPRAAIASKKNIIDQICAEYCDRNEK